MPDKELPLLPPKEAPTKRVVFHGETSKGETKWNPAPPRALTQHWVTTALVTILASTIAIHYIAFAAITIWVEDLEAKEAALESLSDILGTVFPAEVGLVGTATAFYFSQQACQSSKNPL